MDKNQTISIDDKIIEYCKKRNMQVHIAGDLIFITTPFGKWFMDKTENPITLYHASTKLRAKRPCKLAFKSEYHRQDKKFDTCFAALRYIRNHDFYKLKREIKRENHFVSHNNN